MSRTSFSYYAEANCTFQGDGPFGSGAWRFRGWIREDGPTGVDLMRVHVRLQTYGQNFLGRWQWVTTFEGQASPGVSRFPDALATWAPARSTYRWGRWSPGQPELGWGQQAAGYHLSRLQYKFEWLKHHTFRPDEHKHTVDWTTATDSRTRRLCAGQPTL